jgi:hypothetical protein
MEAQIIGKSYGPACGLVGHILLNYPDYEVVVPSTEDKESWLNSGIYSTAVKQFGKTPAITVLNAEALSNRNIIYIDCLKVVGDVRELIYPEFAKVICFEFHHHLSNQQRMQEFESKGVSQYQFELVNYIEQNRHQLSEMAQITKS